MAKQCNWPEHQRVMTEFGGGMFGLVNLELCPNCEHMVFGTTSIRVEKVEEIQNWAEAAREMLYVLEQRGIIE